MSDIAIRVEKLSKQYRIGGPQPRYKTLRESLTEAAQAPFRRAAKLLRGEAYGAAGLDETIWALKDVSFSVDRGEVVGIIGRNGAGKSTLLKILSRITEPTEGHAEIRGRVGSLLEVGTGFHPELTGRENIYLNGAILGMKRAEIEEKFNEIVAFSEIERFIDTPIKHYSSGMTVRLAFSVAAHLEPEILLVDEVLAVGDVAFQKKCLGKMDTIASEGRTVLFVSHNMESILNLCSRGILLEVGRKAAEGPVDDVVQEYLAASFARSECALSERTDRTGNGRIRFKAFFMRDKEGNPIGSVATGDTVDFVLPYEMVDKPIPKVTVWFWILDTRGRGLLCFWSRLTGEDFKDILPKGEFVCRVPCFPLTPGTYAVDIRSADADGPMDCVENAARVEVVTGDFFGTGRALKGIGDFACKHSWRLSG